MSEPRRCTRCILPATCANIDFDRHGVCNFCRSHDRYGPALRDLDSLRPLLEQRLERARAGAASGGRYDCMIGLSGGKDSSYVAYRMTRHHGLRALLVTYDNGFLTDYARDNIRLMAERLGQDHVFLGPDRAYHRWIYRSCMKAFGVPCPGCTFPGMLMCIKLALEEQIPLLIHGRSPAQMFKELTDGTYDPFLKVIYGNLRPYDAAANRLLVGQVVKRMQRLLRSFVRDRELRGRCAEIFHPDPRRLAQAEHAPEFLGLFLYEPYDELAMMGELERELGWRRPEAAAILTHEDCQVHHAAAHFYTQVCGQPMIAQELSTMIRRGELTREQALARLEAEQPLLAAYPAEQAATLAELAGFSEAQLLRAVRGGRRKMKLFKALLKARNAVKPRARLPLPVVSPSGDARLAAVS